MKRIRSAVCLFFCAVGILLAIIGIAMAEPIAIALGVFVALAFLRLYFMCRMSKMQIEKFGSAKAAAAADRALDYVMIAGQESKTSGASAVARGVVGGAILGPAGILAAAGAKKNTSITLILHYKSGRTKTKTIKLNSKELKRLAPYIK